MFKEKKILVIGDVMLDVYFSGEVNRISPEAPVPVFKKKSERCVLGGAANVVNNLIAAGQLVSIMALIGDDENGKKMREMFSETGVDLSTLCYWERATITKVRFLAENNQQVLRLDIENSNPISEKEEIALLEKLQMMIDQFDMVLLSDYMKGLLTATFTKEVIRIAKSHGKRILVDVKDPNFEKYKGAWLLKPNKKELHELSKMPVDTNDELVEAAKFLIKETECEYVLTTCGAKGMILVGKDLVYHLDTASRSVYDVTGAGDTVIAYLAASLASGYNIKEAMRVANYAAGIQVGKVGTSAVYVHEVEDQMKAGHLHRKVFNLHERNQLYALIAEWRSRGETVVSTNGCFDILHRGHISLLEHAKSFGDHLIVLINSDASVKRLKGPNRPINTEEDRAMVIAALDCVDAVALFDPLLDNQAVLADELADFSVEKVMTAAEAPMGILKMISPDIHVKGGDYTIDQVPEAIYAKEFKAVPFVNGYSTTRTIEKSKKS